MRHVLSPAVVRVRRAPGTLQLSVDPSRALVLTGLPARWEAVIRRSDPADDLDAALAAAGAPPADRERLLDLLGTAGLLVDGLALCEPGDQESARLRPDRASVALVSGARDGGRAAMRRRRRTWVCVVGAGRVGTTVASLLAAGGIGHVLVDDPEPLQPEQLAAGVSADAVGARRGRVADDVASRGSAAVRHDPPPGRAHPDLAVVAPAVGWGRAEAAVLLAGGVPHLVALVVETVGVVGPLVRPGVTSCVRCHDLHRTDRDPGWPAVLDSGAAAPASTACDATLAGLVAAQAAQQALAYIDGWRPATVDGTLETALPYGLTRRRSWSAHPACGCRWDADASA